METKKPYNGQGKEQQTEAERILGSTPEHEEYKKEPFFYALDMNNDISNEDKYNLIGLIGDVKRATEVTLCAEKEYAKSESTNVEKILDALDLEYVKETEPSEYDHNSVEVNFYVAKTIEDADRLKKLFEEYRAGDPTGDAAREIGRMLGFPQTAIEYFISRDGSDILRDGDNIQNHRFYIHSPDNSEEEYRQYEERINGLFTRYCPLSARDLLIKK